MSAPDKMSIGTTSATLETRSIHIFKRFLTGAVMTGFGALLGTSLGCDQSSPSPTQPTVPAQPPVIVPFGPPPSLTAISPDSGSTGGTGVTITGTGFRSPAIVTLGGILTSNYVFTSTTIITSAPAHAAGSVDVVVTNPDGQAGRLAGGFTHASPGSFEVNGNWEGGADSNYGTPLRFTIENNTLPRDRRRVEELRATRRFQPETGRALLVTDQSGPESGCL